MARKKPLERLVGCERCKIVWWVALSYPAQSTCMKCGGFAEPAWQLREKQRRRKKAAKKAKK